MNIYIAINKCVELKNIYAFLNQIKCQLNWKKRKDAAIADDDDVRLRYVYTRYDIYGI